MNACWRLMAVGLVALGAVAVTPSSAQDQAETRREKQDDAPPVKDERSEAKSTERNGDGEERRRFDWRRQPPPVSAEFRAQVIAVIQDLQAQAMSEEQRIKLMEMQPDEFMRVFRDNAGTVLAFARLRERTPDLYELRVRDYHLMREVRLLATEVRKLRAVGETEAADAIIAKMRGLVNEQFEIDLKARAIEVRLLEERIALMKRELEERKVEQSSHVDQRVQRVIESDSRRNGESQGDVEDDRHHRSGERDDSDDDRRR